MRRLDGRAARRAEEVSDTAAEQGAPHRGALLFWGRIGFTKEAAERILKQLYVDSMVFTGEGLRDLAVEVGPRHIMIGTDYGFPWVTDPVGHVLGTPGLSDADKIAILGGTLQKLLGIAH